MTYIAHNHLSDISGYVSFMFSDQKSEIVTQTAKSIFDIDYEKLHSEGVELLIFDYDDTLAGQSQHIDQRTEALLTELSGGKYQYFIGILSNRSSSGIHVDPIITNRIVRFDIGNVRKPHPDAFTPIMKKFNILPEQSAMIGDRAATDMWGAYQVGFKHRILVEPYSSVFGGNKAYPLHRLLRKIEHMSVGVHW